MVGSGRAIHKGYALSHWSSMYDWGFKRSLEAPCMDRREKDEESGRFIFIRRVSKCNSGRRVPTFIGMELRCPGFSSQLRIGLGNEHSKPLIERAGFVGV